MVRSTARWTVLSHTGDVLHTAPVGRRGHGKGHAANKMSLYCIVLMTLTRTTLRFLLVLMFRVTVHLRHALASVFLSDTSRGFSCRLVSGYAGIIWPQTVLTGRKACDTEAHVFRVTVP